MTAARQILDELDSLYGELKNDARIGDVNPESVAKALLETMKLFGRYIADTIVPVTAEARRTYHANLPRVARDE